MAALRDLYKFERGLFDSLANLEDFMEKFDAKQDAAKVASRLERLETIFKDFMENRARLEAKHEQELNLAGEPKDSGEKEKKQQARESHKTTRLDFENRYFVLKDFFVSKRVKPTAEASSHAPPPCQPLSSRFQLPMFKIPSFDGNLTKWLSFRDAFKSVIDKDPSLSGVDKLNFLRSVVQLGASTTVEGLDVNESNFDVAWDLLTLKYENNKLISRALMDELLDAEPMRRESYEALETLMETFERNLLQLKKLGLKTDDWSPILAHLLYSNLDADTQRHWENHHKSREVPTYKEMLKFLQDHLTTLQPRANKKPRVREHRQDASRPTPRTKFGSTLTTTTSSQMKMCPFCQKPFHSPFKCESFLKLNPFQRYDLVRKVGLCLNCLNPFHSARACPSSACRVCGQRHHTMLHRRSTNTPNQDPEHFLSHSTTHAQSHNQPAKATNSQSQSQNSAPPMLPTTSNQPSLSLAACTPNDVNVVFLSTAVVKIADAHGNTYLARALLDCCSERNLISERLAQKLVLRRQNDPLSLQGVGSSQAISKQSTMAQIISRWTDYSIDMKFHILPEFKPIVPSNHVPTQSWNHPIPSSLFLADPRFFEPNQIDLIIGAEVHYRLLLNGFIDLGPNLPILKETVFGWIVSGKFSTSSRPSSLTMVCSNADLEKQVARFWELESCHSESVLSVEEKQCEEYFTKTTFRDSTGRFVVRLPKKEAVLKNLGQSRAIAERRFHYIERRLQAKPALRESYAAFIREYVDLGHMVVVDPHSDILAAEANPYYMPHHCIERPESTSTKLRVVFDASCATDTGISLNDALAVGPVVQDDLFSLILRFRLQPFVLVADIEKMYRQVLVHPEDRYLQRILYRESPTEPLQTYELQTVTYGIAYAPFLATRCLKQLALEEECKYPEAAKVLAKDFYMDDLLSGVETEQEGVELSRQLIELLDSAGFKLCKWASNSSTILQTIPAELREPRSEFELDSSSAPIKTLGLLWQPADDVFLFKVPIWDVRAPITKRLVVSDTARLFDPQGLVGPVILRSKTFVQQLWKAKVAWDRILSENQQQYWKQFRTDLDALNTFKVPRWAAPGPRPVDTQLHIFCDASELGYGACAYLRTETVKGTISVNLLTAKSRIVSLCKLINLPRLELCGALFAAHLYEKIAPNLPPNVRVFFWTDSMLVLHWLAASPSRWKKFVANRVSEIQEMTAGHVWLHVPGVDNPADVISRGMTATQLIDCMLWWQGPSWLRQCSRFWPCIVRTSDDLFNKEQLEVRPVVALPAVAETSIFGVTSSLVELTRKVAYYRRFFYNARGCNRTNRRVGSLSIAELNESLLCLTKLAQQESFSRDLHSIRTTGQVESTSKLKSLSPILVDGVLRARGRLQHADVPYDRKHPIILDNKHPLTLMIMRYNHLKYFHAGPQLLIAAVRAKFWPLRARDLARKVVHECVDCFRCKPRTSDQIMGDLPAVRVMPILPFLNSGVDFCGPFYLRQPHRKAAPQKCFVAVFVCMATKAVHLELVGDLSADSFIAALKRFAARRGVPKTMFCDNGTNFVGARRTLNEFLQLFRTQQVQDQVVRSCSVEGIQFEFIPPRSPHFGGIWEAAVKSLKNHLRRTVGNSNLTAEQMTTFLAQAEACLNSRPLSPISNNPDDLDILTPGHFLVHRPLIAIPEPSYEEIARNRLSQWQMIQEYLRRLWKRWSTEYLSGLQQRTRWTHVRDNIRIGTMVLVKEDNLPPQKWRIGRVIEIFPGSDGHVRVVKLRTPDGIYTRAITRLCVLPIDNFYRPKVLPRLCRTSYRLPCCFVPAVRGARKPCIVGLGGGLLALSQVKYLNNFLDRAYST